MTKTRANTIISLIANLDLDNYKNVKTYYNEESMSINIEHKPSMLTIKLSLDKRDNLAPLLEHEKTTTLELLWENIEIDNTEMLNDVEPKRTKVIKDYITNLIEVDSKEYVLREDMFKFLSKKDILIFSAEFSNKNTLKVVGELNQPSSKDILFDIEFFSVPIN